MSGIKHQHRCLVCFEKWDCLQDCDLSRGHHVEECASCYAGRTKHSEEHKREFDRFAEFVGAIRDLLRWIDVANKLELGSVVLRSNVEQVIERRGCDCSCFWYGGEQEHNDDCDGDCYPCAGHEIGSVLDMHHEAEDKLQREGELLRAKGAKL